MNKNKINGYTNNINNNQTRINITKILNIKQLY